jgi:hypothetical protein
MEVLIVIKETYFFSSVLASAFSSTFSSVLAAACTCRLMLL